MQLPFIHLNLLFNPFGELTPQQRKEIAVVDLPSCKDILYKKSVAIQFYADHGRGKTTHLLALHKMYPETEYIKLHTGDQIKTCPQKILFIDSVENLSKRNRLKLYGNTSSIAITSHTDLSRELKQAGYQVLNIKISVRDDALLFEILNRRIEYARRDKGNIPVVDMQSIYKLKTEFGDNIRAIEACLYEKFQNMSGIENVNM